MTGKSAATWHPGDRPDLPGLDEAVEAVRVVARTLHRSWCPWPDHEWSTVEWTKAQQIVTAAYPVIAAAVLRDMADRTYNEGVAGWLNHHADRIGKGDDRG